MKMTKPTGDSTVDHRPCGSARPFPILSIGHWLKIFQEGTKVSLCSNQDFNLATLPPVRSLKCPFIITTLPAVKSLNKCPFIKWAI